MTEKKPRFWKSLPPEDKKGIVENLLKAGYSRSAVGKALGTTKNAVVGYQHRKLPELTSKTEGILDTVPKDVLSGLLIKVWPVEASASSSSREETAAASRLLQSGHVSHKLANAWNQCKYSGGCAYECLPGMNSCGRSGHNK